jgi:hypothetical protein
MWTQIVGKVKLVLSPFLNEYWHVAFQLTPRGLSTGNIPIRDRTFEIRFDFVDHDLYVETGDGEVSSMALQSRSVAEFYGDFMNMLGALGIDVTISTMPSEVPNPIPFDADLTHGSYDPEYVGRWWQIQLQTERVLQRYRSTFVGKSSPIHFFWGSFDLAHTRFSGRSAPPLEGVPRFFRLSEDQENATCGFWPGNPNPAGAFGIPAFYSYVYPAPDGLSDATIKPDAARFNTELGEFILLYDDVRRSSTPEKDLLAFFQSAYEAAATLASWDHAALERPAPA